MTRPYDAGGQLWPVIDEGGHRVVWRRLAVAVLDGEAVGRGLADLAEDLALSKRLEVEL